ncbi:hypothetical protein chiPu_0009129 [Chiloscyllium punctatum]|uniref:Uncharacterized protein n=1 Tax=Chiloscyllium punctatum TaxID=137246 RepID=A0A401SJY4_CHIPU|nr:hypothetical protein [Chiloscyllium punctatum]
MVEVTLQPIDVSGCQNGRFTRIADISAKTIWNLLHQERQVAQLIPRQEDQQYSGMMLCYRSVQKDIFGLTS